MTDPLDSQVHVVIGAGPAGRATAAYLQRQGHRVVLASRSGTGPEIPGVERVAVEATDAHALAQVVTGAAAMYNCMNPTSYTRWAREWPPIHRALMDTAQVTGAVLVVLSNLYMYGPMRHRSALTSDTVEEPQDDKGRIRAWMDRETLAAHRAGTIRAVIVRASDFLGPGIGDNGHGTRNVSAIAAGRRAVVLGKSNQPHSWTDISDVAATLGTVAPRPEAHGRVWFAPTNPPVTQRQLAIQTAAALELSAPKISTLPLGLLRVLGMVSPLVRELASVAYQFTGPWVMDSSTTTQSLGLQPTAWDQVVGRSAAGNLE